MKRAITRIVRPRNAVGKLPTNVSYSFNWPRMRSTKTLPGADKNGAKQPLRPLLPTPERRANGGSVPIPRLATLGSHLSRRGNVATRPHQTYTYTPK